MNIVEQQPRRIKSTPCQVTEEKREEVRGRVLFYITLHAWIDLASWDVLRACIELIQSLIQTQCSKGDVWRANEV